MYLQAMKFDLKNYSFYDKTRQIQYFILTYCYSKHLYHNFFFYYQIYWKAYGLTSDGNEKKKDNSKFFVT